MKNLLVSILFFTAILNCSFGQQAKETEETRPKNIILMIGDGMGISQIYSGMVVNMGWLNIERMRYIGFSKTYSASDFITDSGAGGTAIATGKKTYNGAIGVGTDTMPVKSVLHLAEENGLSTGLVATSTITHATPASFIAHQKSRNSYEAIAADFLKTDIDLFIGGGKNHFEKRSDSINLSDKLRQKGYQVIYDTVGLKKAANSPVAALLSDSHMPAVSEGRGNMLPLSVEVAIEHLSDSNKGFFLMVEGSQIDWACHDTNATYLVEEMIDFDKAVGKALDFAEKDGNTLVIVTADHETGGVAVTGGDIKKGSAEIEFVCHNHTGVPVPVFAFGPGAESFIGFYENTGIFDKMIKLFGFSD
ncbi:MAG: alkaline phosphatase [Bacteroidales bacterium]|nr:alkaline phosphatase [Bacteroidales bacterium]